MILKFNGVVWLDSNDEPYIGKSEDTDHKDIYHSVVWILNYGFEGIGQPFANDARVYVAIADERFDGDLYALQGLDGYSEWTPGSVAELTVGPHNLIEELRRYEGQTITMWIADEPVNTLEDK